MASSSTRRCGGKTLAVLKAQLESQLHAAQARVEAATRDAKQKKKEDEDEDSSTSSSVGSTRSPSPAVRGGRLEEEEEKYSSGNPSIPTVALPTSKISGFLLKNQPLQVIRTSPTTLKISLGKANVRSSVVDVLLSLAVDSFDCLIYC